MTSKSGGRQSTERHGEQVPDVQASSGPAPCACLTARARRVDTLQQTVRQCVGGRQYGSVYNVWLYSTIDTLIPHQAKWRLYRHSTSACARLNLKYRRNNMAQLTYNNSTPRCVFLIVWNCTSFESRSFLIMLRSDYTTKHFFRLFEFK